MEQNNTNLPEDANISVKTAEKEPKTKQPGEVGFGTYFGLIVLFLVPVVGFIASIVYSFAPKNRNIKNFARAAMTLWIVEIVSTAIAIGVSFFALRAISDAMSEYITDPEFLSSFGPMGEVLSQIPEEDLQTIIEEYQTGGLDGVVEKFQSGEFDHLIEQFQNGAFGDPQDILDQFEQGGYGDWSDILDQVPSTDTSAP